MTSQLHISKFEILSLSNKIHKNSDFLSLMLYGTLFWTEKALKYFVFMDFIEETKDFKFWNVELGCHFCSFLRKSYLCVQLQFMIFDFLTCRKPPMITSTVNCFFIKIWSFKNQAIARRLWNIWTHTRNKSVINFHSLKLEVCFFNVYLNYYFHLHVCPSMC